MWTDCVTGSQAINYFTFDLYSKALLRLGGSGDGHAERFLAGAMAGMCCPYLLFAMYDQLCTN